MKIVGIDLIFSFLFNCLFSLSNKLLFLSVRDEHSLFNYFFVTVFACLCAFLQKHKIFIITFFNSHNEIIASPFLESSSDSLSSDSSDVAHMLYCVESIGLFLRSGQYAIMCPTSCTYRTFITFSLGALVITSLLQIKNCLNLRD